MRYLLSLLLILGLFSPIIGADAVSSLTLKGDVTIVDVPRTVVVVDKVQVVNLTMKSLIITAPPGATDYRWSVPPGVIIAGGTDFSDEAETLEITSAPKGSLTVKVRMRTSIYNEATKKFDTTVKIAQIKFNVGSAEPSADNPFADAWKAETTDKKANYVAVVAGLYRGYAEEAKNGKRTGKELLEFMSAAFLAAQTDGEKISGKLPKTVMAVNQWLGANLKTPEGQLTAAERDAAVAAFNKVATWLSELQ